MVPIYSYQFLEDNNLILVLLLVLYLRGRRPEVFCRKGVLRNFTKLTGKHLYQSIFFKKRDFGTGVFLWILWTFYKQTPFL